MVTKMLKLFLATCGLAVAAQAKTVYIQCAWENSLTQPASQTVEFYNGSSKVGEVVVYKSNGWKGSGSISATFDRVEPVPPSGAEATADPRDYGCKPFSQLVAAGDLVHTKDTPEWRSWTDRPDSSEIEGWNGWMLVSAARTSNASVYCKPASSGGPIYDVSNTKLKTIQFTASSYEGEYDGSGHGINVSVTSPSSGYSITYSESSGGTYSSTKPTYVNVGTYTTYFKIEAPHCTPRTGSATVKINKAQIVYSAPSYSVSNDGLGHSIAVTVHKPSSNFTIRYSETDGGPWSLTAPPSYTTTGAHTTYFRIEASDTANYISPAYGSATVTINDKQDFVCHVTGGTWVFDGTSHGVSVEYPSGATVYYSKDNKTWRSWNNYFYTDVGEYVTYVKVTRGSAYNDWYGSATIRITQGTLGWGNISHPEYTNTTYTGKAPWQDTDYYDVFYCTNCWDVGEWEVIFIGKGNYTGTVTNRFRVGPAVARIYSATQSKTYDGTPLVNTYVGQTGFVTGEGLASGSAFGSQTDVGSSPNPFTYALKANTNPNNYDLSIVTGQLSVVAVKPQSLKYPERLDIVGPDRLDVGIPKSYSAYVTYSDGTSNTVSSTWSLAPNEPKARFTSGMPTSSATVRALPKGAGETLTLSVPYTMTYGTGAVTNEIVAWHPFDDATSYDMSIYNKTGYRKNSSQVSRATDRANAENRAYRFSGESESYVYVSDASPFNGVTNALTIAAWIRPETTAEQGVLCRGEQIKFSVRQNGTWLFNGTTYATGTGFTPNEWQHVVLSWDGSKVRAYVNGTKVNEFSRTGKLTAATSSELRIGRSGSVAFTGSMDDVRIYSRPLSLEEVSFVYRGVDVTSATASKTVIATKTVTVNSTTTIPVALDVETPTGAKTDNTPTKLTFTPGSTWYGQYETVYGAYNEDDYDAAQSGHMTGAGTSYMETSVTGAGTVYFYWKTDCENTYDYLVFKVDGAELARVSGSNDWKQMSFSLTNRNHTLRWEYVKDGYNSLGKDAAWVDRLVWAPVQKPQSRTDVAHPVNATDGEYDSCVEVTWYKPNSQKPITEYKVSRKVDGKSDSTYIVLADGLTAREYRDYAAAPGVDYTYKVEAKNTAGWGSGGTDNGYRGVVLAISPDSCHFSNVASNEVVFVSVTSNALWKVAPRSSDTWIHVTPTNGGFLVRADSTTVSSGRSGIVTVTCGLTNNTTLAHYRTENFNVRQDARIDVAFVKPYNDWRTELQITTNGLAVADAYSPVPVFAAAEGMKISFGWRNNGGEEVELPPVRFKVFDPTNPVPVMKWVDVGTDVTFGRVLAPNSQTNCAFWSGAHLGALPPGDYALEAELDPDDRLCDPDRDNNKTRFRFAVRNPAYEFGRDVFAGACWSNLEATVGSDFAQAPHVARRQISYTNSVGARVLSVANAVQFGPYVPMNGENGREITARKGVDIVFLVDFSSSMDQCIDGLVNNIGVFIDHLLLGDPGRGIMPISDLRIKIAGFSDIQSDCTFKNWFEEGVFTADRSLLREKLEELRSQCYGGGGNGGESSYDALYYICKGWRTPWDPADKTKPTTYQAYDPAEEEMNGHLHTFRSTNVTARAVVMFTDEPPHVPMNAPGCPNAGNLDGLRQALVDADINLTVIGDGFYYKNYQEYADNIHWLRDLTNGCPQASNGTDRWVLMETSNGNEGAGTIARFTQDTSRLVDLAETIYLQTPEEAVIEEPTFTAVACGEGTLTFRWCNDSTDSANTTFTFTSEAGTMTRRADAPGASWDPEVSIEFGDGTHPFRWSYRKIDYAGAVSDCGLVADVSWKPRDVELEVTPIRTYVDWLGTNKTQIVTNDAKIVDGVVQYSTNKVYGAIFDVKCNSSWTVVDYPTNWVTIVQGSGSGNGRIIVNVAENPLFGERLGALTVVARDYGLSEEMTKSQSVFIEQSGRPLEEDGSVRIHMIDIKPRWPWSRKVDIDFLVQTPTKSTNTPVRVMVWGLNKEGAGIITYTEGGNVFTNYPTAALLQECVAKKYVEVGKEPENRVARISKGTVTKNAVVYNDTGTQVGGTDAAGVAYIHCPTSGLYRFTWDMAQDWADASESACKSVSQGGTGLGSTYYPWKDGSTGVFHTPEFSVRLRATPVYPLQANNEFAEMEAEETRRVDMRLLSDGDAIPNKPPAGKDGGSILTGNERIGHPYGWVDPVRKDTTDKTLFPSNGWNVLDFVEDLPNTHTNQPFFACVINDPAVAIEGGTITNDTHWTADKIHIVRDNVFVAPGAKLTIDAETIVKICLKTRIYVYEDEFADAITNRHNIIAEGCYFTTASDKRCGGDTLHMGDSASSGSSTASSGITVGNDIVYSQVQAGNSCETEECYLGTKRCQNHAIYRLELAEAWLSTNGTVTTSSKFGYKYYGRGQRYGETIFRPSEPGCAFYGWYTNQPTKSSGPMVLGPNLSPTNSWNAKGVQISTNYVGSKRYQVNPDVCPFPLVAKNSELGDNKAIHALVCPTNWGEGVEGVVPIMTDASYALVSLQTNDVITLGVDRYEAVYNGRLHKPFIETIKLPDRPPLPKACYEPDYGEYADGFKTAGVYRVSAHFTSAYSGSPHATFEVKPRPVVGSDVVFTPPEVLYRPRRFGGVAKPAVSVIVPGMGEHGEPDAIPATDYVTNWVDDATWPNPGTYHVEITFNSNYSGVLTNSYVIEKNPEYDFTSPRTSVGTGAAAAALAKTTFSVDTGKPKRILYFGGEIPEDAETAYMKSLITDDVDFNEWIIDNFVVWTNDVNEADSPYEKYTEGMAMTAYPLICVLNPDDLDNPVLCVCGYMDKDELWALLSTALSGRVPASLAEVEFKPGRGTLTYSGAVLCPGTSDVTVTYAGAALAADKYVMVPETNSVDVGTYRVAVRMKSGVSVGDYVITGETAFVEYQIAPCAVSDASSAAVISRLGVALSPASATYDGEVHHPAVTSAVPYVGVDYGTDDWCNIGIHTLTVTFDGNYKGTISKTFTISAKPVTADIELDRYSEEVQEGKASTQIKPNVLKVSDRDTGYVYSEGADYDLSFEGGFVSAGTNWVVATFKGNYSGEARAQFVIEGTAAVFEALDDLPSTATPAQVLAALYKFVWVDTNCTVRIRDIGAYNGFKGWTEMVGLDTAKCAQHAYVSYRVSELLDAATNLASVAGMAFEISDISLDETMGGMPCVCVTISLKDGGTAIAFTSQLNAAKAAFAKLVRRASTLGGLVTGTVGANEIEVEAVSGDRTKVRIKVLPPSGSAGFVRIVLE